MKKFSSLEFKKIKSIFNDPVKWAQAFVKIFNPVTKQVEPWKARWYQVEMLRDESVKKVYRCGRRIGRVFCLYAEKCEKPLRVLNY